MIIWSGEIKGLVKLYESFKGHLPDIVKELEKLIKTQDANVVMLYSRRCLEVIITDLCESELKRPRKTEPLKGIIDKLNSEEKVPSHIISSMLSLNSMSTYGTHPKDFDPEQVKPVLNNLTIIIRWYLKYKDFKIINQQDQEGEKQKNKERRDLTEVTKKPKKRLVLFLTGLSLGITVIALIVIIFIGVGNKNRGNGPEELEKTIAVLPFMNLSNDSSQAYFCDGFMEEILNNLQRVREFTVRSRTSSDQYRKSNKTSRTIGEEMNVNYLIRGSVGKEDNNLKIWIQLINAKTDENIWANEYTREMKQIFSLQSEISKEIADELKTVLSPDEIMQIDKDPTENLEAYNYYLLGNDYYWRSLEKQNFEIASNMYIKAIESDPNFALAYVRLSICYLSLHWFYYDPIINNLEKSKEAIDKVFKINPDLPQAHLCLGYYYYWGFLDYIKALEEINIAERTLKNNPECIYVKASIYRRAGEWALAKENYLKGFELDPGSSRVAIDIANTYYLLREYEEAEKYYDKAISLNPAFIEAFFYKSLMYMKWQGNTIKARETIAEAFQFNESSSNPMMIELNVLMDIYDGKYEKALSYLSSKDIDIIEIQRYYLDLKALLFARIYYLMNMPEMALKYYHSASINLESRILKSPDDPRLYSALGIAYAGLGLKEKAINAGERAVELMPINKDAWNGVYRVEGLARIYVMVGEYNEALEQIKLILSLPGPLSVGFLQLDPDWKPLLDMPEFKEIAEMASL